MRKSLNVSDIIKIIITHIKSLQFENVRVTDSYVINESVKSCGTELLEKLLSSKVDRNQYSSKKYTLDYTTNSIIEELMNKGYTANAILTEALKQSEQLQLYKHRARIIQSNPSMKIIGTNNINLSLSDFLPLIYSISLSNGEDSVVLYVGKSKLFASRSPYHISSIIDDPAYLGLTESDFKNSELSLVFKVEEEINVLECDSMIQFEHVLKKAESKIISKLSPITQQGEIMIKDQEEKRLKVKEAIEQLLQKKKY